MITRPYRACESVRTLGTYRLRSTKSVASHFHRCESFESRVKGGKAGIDLLSFSVPTGVLS
jgi:hypothetical protein